MIIEINGPFGFKQDSTWEFDSDPILFQWYVRMAMLLRELYNEKETDPFPILLDRKKAEAAMQQRGITERAVTMEMIRNGLELAMRFNEDDVVADNEEGRH